MSILYAAALSWAWHADRTCPSALEMRVSGDALMVSWRICRRGEAM